MPWSLIDEALAATGPLDGRIVVDTTNQFGSGPMPSSGPDGRGLQRRPHARLPLLIRDAGYEPVDLGGVDDCAVMEAPRCGRPLPPVPSY